MEIKKIRELFSSLWSFIHNIKDEMSLKFLYKIIGIEVCKTSGEFIIYFKAPCAIKPFYQYLPAIVIMINDNIIKNFHPLEARLITFVAIKNKYENSYYLILDQTFSDEISTTKFKLINIITREIFIKTSLEILYSEEIIMNLSKNDILNVAYSAGFEYSTIVKKGVKNEES